MSDDTVVIIGAGLMGSAAARSLARRGHRVVVLEQYAIGHAAGSSHGSARIVRRAYSDELYTRLTGRAFELWQELEAATSTPLLRLLGGVDFGPHREVSAVAEHLAATGVPHEILPAAAAEQRWPGMRFDTPVVFHAQAGTLDAEAANRALLAEATRSGATVRTGAAAVALHDEPRGVRVVCSDGSELAAGAVVVAAGAWVEPLLRGVIELPPLRVTRQHVFHFPRREPSAPPWPSVIHERAHAVYHLAGGRDGGPGDDRKLGVHDGGVPAAVSVGALPVAEVPAAARAAAIEYVRNWLPGLVPEPRGETTCLYTQTPSENFLIDRVGRIVVCSPCSGHGAKFAPLVGEYVAGLIAGEGSVPERFRLRTHLAGLDGAVSL